MTPTESIAKFANRRCSAFQMVALLLFLLLDLLAAKAVILGDTGAWQTHWHGTGVAQQDALKLPRSCAVVVRALEAAKKHDFASFTSLYKGADAHNTNAQIKLVYDDLSELLQTYAMLIAHEALLTNLSSDNSVVYSAVSVVPAALLADTPTPEGRAQISPRILFSQQTDNGWKLLVKGVDDQLEQALRQQADSLCYQPNAFSKAAVDKMLHQAHESQLEQMRKSGISSVRITSMKEFYRQSEQGVMINSWETWTNYYKAVILDPPIVFDIRDEAKMDFSNPLSAFHSYKRAAFLRDTQTLTNYSDQYAGAELQKWHVREKSWLQNTQTNVPAAARPVITILLTATTLFDGANYVMVLWRGQDADVPTNKMISFQTTFFKYDAQKDSYLLTQDLSHGSVFDSLFGLAGASGVGFSTYNKFYETMKNSRFPKHFYTVE